MSEDNGNDEMVNRVNGHEQVHKRATHIRMTYDLRWADRLVSFKAQITTDDHDVIYVGAERAVRGTMITDHGFCQALWDKVLEPVREHVLASMHNQPIMFFLPKQLNDGPRFVDARGEAASEPECEPAQEPVTMESESNT
jgi:hypothetical protein